MISKLTRTTQLTPYLTPRKPGQPRIYTKERKQCRRDNYNRYYHAHKAKCNLSTKKDPLTRQLIRFCVSITCAPVGPTGIK